MYCLYFLYLFVLGNNLLCGEVEGLNVEKIVGGKPARRRHFRYVVALRYKEPGEPDVNPCAASILSDWFVATAAHCFYFKPYPVLKHKFFYITIGTNNLNVLPLWAKHVAIDTITMPTIYDPSAPDTFYTQGNLAIVRSSESFKLNENLDNLANLILRPSTQYIRVAEFHKLAGYGYQRVEVYMGEINGNIEPMQDGFSDETMYYLKLKVLPIEQCEEIYQGTFAPGNICAKAVRVDPNQPSGICLGDSGAPLANERSDILDGIAINGCVACDEEIAPGIYLNASYPYYKWFIQQVLNGVRNNDMYILQLQQPNPDEFILKEIWNGRLQQAL